MSAITARTTAYMPISEDSGIVVIADPEWMHLEEFEIEAVPAGGYWRIVTSGKPGTLAPQICSGFWTSGSTLYGEGAPERTADKVYKTRRGLDGFIARARAAGCSGV